MHGTDVALARIAQLVDDYQRLELRLGEQVRRKKPVVDRAVLYRNLADAATRLARHLGEEHERYQRKAESWLDSLERLYPEG